MACGKRFRRLVRFRTSGSERGLNCRTRGDGWRYFLHGRPARYSRSSRGVTALRDVAFAFRFLTRNPSYAFAAVAVAALGVGASTAVFSVVHGVLLDELPYPDAEPARRLSCPRAVGPRRTGADRRRVSGHPRARRFVRRGGNREQLARQSDRRRYDGARHVRVDQRRLPAAVWRGARCRPSGDLARRRRTDVGSRRGYQLRVVAAPVSR